MPLTDAHTTYPPFSLARSCAVLTGLALAVGAVMATLLASVPGWSAGAYPVAYAAVVAWLASLASLLPVAATGRYGVAPTVTAYFAGVAGRILLCALAAVLGVMALHLALQPLLLGLAGMYLPLLPAEAALVGRHLSAKDRPPLPAPGNPQDRKEAVA